MSSNRAASHNEVAWTNDCCAEGPDLRRRRSGNAPEEHVPIFLGRNQLRERIDRRQHSGGRCSFEHRWGWHGPDVLPGRCRALVGVACRRRSPSVDHAAVFLDGAPGAHAARNGVPGLLLPLSRRHDGQRAWRCELSTMDTAILIAGALTAAAYFDRRDTREQELRKLADALYRRVDWRWAQNGGATVSHGWRPETRVPQISVAGLQRGTDSVRAWSGSPDASFAEEELSGPGRRPTAGRSSTGRSCSMAARCSCISSPISGWIFRDIQDAFMRKKGDRLLREQSSRRRRSISSTRSGIRKDSRGMASTGGVSRRATALARPLVASREPGAAF